MKKLGKAGSTFATVIAAVLVLAIATTSGAVAGSLVTSKKIKNNTIKSIDVRDNTLTSADVRDGSLGKVDLAASARGFTAIVTKRQTDSGVANGDSSTLTVVCGAGQVAIGGGAYVVPNIPINLNGSTAGVLERSHPAVTGTTILDTPGTFAAGDNVAPNAWRTTVRNDQGATESAIHYALCASK